MAGKGLGDDVLGIDAYDGVGGGYGCADGVVGGEGGETAVDDGVADVGAYGVVYEEELVAVSADAEGGEGAVVSLATAGEYVGDFGVGGGDVAHVVDVVGAGDDDDLVDVGVAVEGAYGVLDDGHAVHVEKLFGLVGSEAASAAACQ